MLILRLGRHTIINSMDSTTRAALLEINRRFYRDCGVAFAATRRRIQPGVRRALGMLPAGGDWLDLGCGSGTLALEWAKSRRSGSYTGVDFSAVLLDIARREAREVDSATLELRFVLADVSATGWEREFTMQRFEGALAFASLHHLPDTELRLNLLRTLRTLLKPEGWFVHSEWQFQHSPRLLERVLSWERAGIDSRCLEPGDTLLDWRAQGEMGLRYVHLFSAEELEKLAQDAGFKVVEQFSSDGAGGKLGLYQIWRVSA
jgi:tRNA (uracil-5-)-methyltransferase TRM9